MSVLERVDTSSGSFSHHVNCLNFQLDGGVNDKQSPSVYLRHMSVIIECHKKAEQWQIRTNLWPTRWLSLNGHLDKMVLCLYCSLYIIRLSIHVYGKHSEMDTYCWPVPKVSILEAVYCSCGLVAVLALSGCTLKVGNSSITRSASESSQKALTLSYQPDSASTKSIHQLFTWLCTVYLILLTWTNQCHILGSFSLLHRHTDLFDANGKQYQLQIQTQ